MKRSGLKKPSAAPSIQATISKLSRGVSKSDLVANKKDKDAEETEPETTGRDKAKGQKYLKLKDSLPDHIVDLVEKQSLKACFPQGVQDHGHKQALCEEQAGTFGAQHDGSVVRGAQKNLHQTLLDRARECPPRVHTQGPLLP